MSAEDTHIGRTISTLRKAAGLTQRQLASRANVSLSLLSKAEVGDRAVSHSLLAAVARTLRIPVERLTGQPYTDHRRDERTHQHIDALRGILRHYDLPEDVPVPTMSTLVAEVRDVARLRRDAEYGKLAARLPALLENLTSATYKTENVEVWQLLVSAYFATHTLVHRLGYGDLAEAVEHKLAWAAERTGDIVAGGVAQWARCTSFQSAGDFVHGLRLMDTAMADLDDELRTRPSAGTITVYGSLHLRAVTLASRAGDASTTRSHLDAAVELGDRLRRDQVHYGLTFGPANAVTHEVAAHVELGEGAAAIEAARRWTPPRAMPRTRRGHHHIDLARAHLLNDDRRSALESLQQARRIAPQQTRLHPMVREATAVLISQHRRANPELAKYASWLGLPA